MSQKIYRIIEYVHHNVETDTEDYTDYYDENFTKKTNSDVGNCLEYD